MYESDHGNQTYMTPFRRGRTRHLLASGGPQQTPHRRRTSLRPRSRRRISTVSIACSLSGVGSNAVDATNLALRWKDVNSSPSLDGRTAGSSPSADAQPSQYEAVRTVHTLRDSSSEPQSPILPRSSSCSRSSNLTDPSEHLTSMCVSIRQHEP